MRNSQIKKGIYIRIHSLIMYKSKEHDNPQKQLQIDVEQNKHFVKQKSFFSIDKIFVNNWSANLQNNVRISRIYYNLSSSQRNSSIEEEVFKRFSNVE